MTRQRTSARDTGATSRQLAATAEEFSTGRAEIDARLRGLRGAVDELVASGFIVAEGAFAERYALLTRSISSTHTALVGMTAYLTGTANALAECVSAPSSAQGRQPDRELIRHEGDV